MNTKNPKLKNLLVVFSFILVFFSVLSEAGAASISVTPVVIDEKAKTRDILRESATLANDTNKKLNVYTFVNDVAVEEGLASSLADWIEISRGVIELLPGGKKEIDFKINVNLRASPGIYHAVIYFAEGPTRDMAEQRIAAAPSVMVNLEVIEDIKERLQLNKFIPDKIFFSGSSVSFSYELENIGNQAVAPSGEIRIYNRRGEEVAAIDANQGNAALEPDAAKQLAGVWHSAEGFGRYKALINLEYGAKQRGAVYDTIYFWLIPWQKILMIFGSLLLVSVLITYYIHRRHE